MGPKTCLACICWLASACSDPSIDKPSLVAGLTPVAAVACGASHTCALLKNGNVGCWGSNEAGQLGSPPKNSSLWSPQGVALDDDPFEIAVGGVHSCAAFQDGSVRCWGDDSLDFLGVDATCAAKTNGCPSGVALVSGITDAVHVAAGGVQAPALGERLGYTCAVRQDGSVACWGDQRERQLGHDGGLSAKVDPTPGRVVDADGFALRGVLKVTAGDHHACALDDMARVWCWGTGPGAGGNSAIQVTEVGDAVDVAAGESHSCAVGVDGSVWCWGSNLNLESAAEEDADTCSIHADCVPHPTPVRGVSGATAVVVGGRHSCALVGQGEVWCWGSNQNGQLGRGPANLMAGPARADLSVAVRSLSAGRAHTCAVTVGSELYCWGDNSAGQLGREP